MTQFHKYNRFPNSREFFYLKLLEHGADDLMACDRVAELLQLKLRTIVHAVAENDLAIQPGIALDQLATFLFRHPAFAPAIAEAKIPLPSLSMEQFQYIGDVARKKLADYRHLCLDELEFTQAVAAALSRNCGNDWEHAVETITIRLLHKFNQEQYR